MLSAARIATLVGFLLITGVAFFAAIDRGRAGTPNATLTPTSTGGEFVVTAALPESRLQRGDRVRIEDPRELAVYQLRSFAVGTVLHVRRIAPPPASAIAVPVVAKPRPGYAAVILWIEALFMGIAAVIAARGRTNGSLSLAWLFALITLLFNPTTPAWPSGLVLTYAIGSALVSVVAFWCATDFASRFAGNADAAWALRIRRISLATGVASGMLLVSDQLYGFLAPVTPVALAYAAYLPLIVQALLFLTTLGIAYATAAPPERQRVAWVGASLATGTVGFIATVVLQNFNLPEPVTDLPLLLMIAMPLGCAYAILRYRLLDIAFVINRATVFGVTSLLVLAALAVVDFGLERLLGSWLLSEGFYVQLGLALAIGIGTRPLHDGVDRFVDDLFFRQRHEAERALRQFARDVAYIDDAAVVLARTVETVTYAERLDCSLLLATSEGSLRRAAGETGDAHEAVDRNDPAVVRLLATRAHVDLHGLQTALFGDFAFPMFARNRLLGVLTCGGKTEGDTAYAPDELEAIGAVAHASGLALDLLRIEALERELAELRGAPTVTSAA